MSAWITGVATVMCGAVALLAPEDVLSAHPALARFYAFMTTLFPVVGHYAVRSTFPEITALYMSLMFSAFPFALLGAVCTLNGDKRLFASIYESQRPPGVSFGKYLFSATVVALVAPPLAYFAWFVNPGLDIFFMDFSRSRIDLAVFGFFVTLAVPAIIGVAIHVYIRLAVGAKQLLLGYLGLFGNTKDEA